MRVTNTWVIHPIQVMRFRLRATYRRCIHRKERGEALLLTIEPELLDGSAEPPGYVRPQVYTTPQGPDPRVQQITRNLFAQMLG